MANVLWGIKEPQFIFNDPLYASPQNGRVIILPMASKMKYFFTPDMISHKAMNGWKSNNFRGFYLYCELYYDVLTKEESIRVRDVINWSSKYNTYFMPHRDFSCSYLVSINEEEGWDLAYAWEKIHIGYNVILVIRGREWITGLNEEEKNYGCAPGELAKQ